MKNKFKFRENKIETNNFFKEFLLELRVFFLPIVEDFQYDSHEDFQNQKKSYRKKIIIGSLVILMICLILFRNRIFN